MHDMKIYKKLINRNIGIIDGGHCYFQINKTVGVAEKSGERKKINELPFKCTSCDKEFLKQKSLNKHVENCRKRLANGNVTIVLKALQKKDC